jgi:hypothetical protein
MVEKMVKECDIYKQAKLGKITYPRLLQPLPILKGAWRDITMDFIEGLSKSEDEDTTLVMVDRFTKYRHFIIISHLSIAQDVVMVFSDHLYRLHDYRQLL